MPYPAVAPVPAGLDETEWAAAIAAIRGYCGWHVGPEYAETVVLDGPGPGVLILPTQRVVAVASVKNGGAIVRDPEWSASGMIRGGWTTKFRGVEVTMTHGFETFPAELVAIAKSLVGAAGRGGVSQVTKGAHSVRWESAVGPEQLASMDRYRLVALP